jgi:hypothetical protein
VTTSYEYQKVHQLDQMAAACGFKISHSGWDSDATLSLIPADDDALPIYNRSAKIASGDVDYLITWIRGWQASREYLSWLKLAEPRKIAKAEDSHRQRVVAAREYVERRRVLKVLKTA